MKIVDKAVLRLYLLLHVFNSKRYLMLKGKFHSAAVAKLGKATAC